MLALRSAVITPASPDDVPEIIAMQRLAFMREAQLYREPNLPPMTETAEELQQALASASVLKAMIDGHIVGSVRGQIEGGNCHVHRLAVHPAYQRQGLGEQLMRAIEDEFPMASMFHLETGHLSESNLRFYTKLGYIEHNRRSIGRGVILVELKRTRPAGCNAPGDATMRQ